MNGNFEISKDEVLEILTKTGRYDKVGVEHLLINKGLADTLTDIMSDIASLEKRVKQYEESYKKLEGKYFDLLADFYGDEE